MEELHIGQVTASDAIIQEISETEDFQTYCMGCIRRHRSGDFGDISKDSWINNILASRNGEKVVSEYIIPKIFCIGYEQKIMIVTNVERTETRIQFPDDN